MNPATLRLLIERAKASSELAQARHGGLRRSEDQARTHLNMLRQYAAEYDERARARPGDSRDPSADRNQVVFLARLQVAIDTQVQEVGLLFFGATMLVPAFLLGSFEKLLNYVIFTDTLTLAVVASTLFVLRRRRSGAADADRDGGYSMIGYPVLPALYILCLLGAAARVFTLAPNLALSGILVLATGWPLFRLGRRLFARDQSMTS